MPKWDYDFHPRSQFHGIYTRELEIDEGSSPQQILLFIGYACLMAAGGYVGRRILKSRKQERLISAALDDFAKINKLVSPVSRR